MDTIQNALRAIASVTGLIAMLAPVVSILLTSRRETGHSIGSGSSLRRWPVVVLFMLGFLLTGIFLWIPLNLPLPISIQYVLLWIGFLIYIPAICLYLWGLLTLGRNFGVSSSTGADLISGHQLIRNGPYHFVRHPMYLAVILAAIGAFLVFRTWAMLFFLPMSMVVIRRASQEEKLLALEFGDEWQSYVQKVPSWFPRWLRKNKAS